MRSGIVRTAAGAELCFLERGDPAGVPIFWLHGTPGCRLSQALAVDQITALKARVITYDRPGYGLSTRSRGRKVVDAVSDVLAIADFLELESFVVSGRSGGAPHALALAARAPGRVRRVRAVSGLAPYGAAGLDWFDGMDASNVSEFRAAVRGEELLSARLAEDARGMLERLANDPSQFLATFSLSEADRAAARDPLAQDVLRRAIPEALRGGIGGWVDDDLALVRDWGFEPADISVPVEIQYGLQDVVVPPAHGAWLSRHIPAAVEVPDPVAGHLSTPAHELALLQQLTGTS